MSNTINAIQKVTATTPNLIIEDSQVTDDGTTVAIVGALTVGSDSAGIDSDGNFSGNQVTAATILQVGGQSLLDQNGTSSIQTDGNGTLTVGGNLLIAGETTLDQDGPMQIVTDGKGNLTVGATLVVNGITTLDSDGTAQIQTDGNGNLQANGFAIGSTGNVFMVDHLGNITTTGGLNGWSGTIPNTFTSITVINGLITAYV